MQINGHILITGANGFVGQHLSKAFLARGAKVSQVVRFVSPQALETQYALDLTIREDVANIFSLIQPDFVIHLAGLSNRLNEATQFYDTYDTNLSMSLNVIDACRKIENFKRLVFLGSCDEYGLAPTPYNEAQREMPTNAYGLSKLAVTQILISLFHSHRFPSVILRPTVIYGSGQGNEMFISSLIQSLLAGRDFAMTNGDQQRDYIYINDVVDAIIKVVSSNDKINGAVLNIGGGVSYQIKEVAKLVADLVGPKISRLIQFGAIQYRSHEVMHYSVEIERARELLGWYPNTNISVGLQHTIQQYKKSMVNSISED